MQMTRHNIKDEGLKRMVYESYPYRVVRGAYDGSMDETKTLYTALTHIVPTGHQLKILFLRVWTQEAGGAVFRINQTNPTALGTTGEVEAYPVVGSAPAGVVDYPMLEAAGAEVLTGNLHQPVHVVEGSVDFSILRTPNPATGNRYGIVWWGFEELPEQEQ
uniref:Uncharacterized protein n=1 Tax=viral metagenome TaxID=1070528 RepID=A0A6M3M508_9ZZZZ